MANYVVTASALNVRTGPSTGYSVVDCLYYGQEVTVSNTSGDWGQIGSNRWVCMDYLSKKSSGTAVNASYMVTASALNVRSGPGTNYAAVDLLSYGTVKTVYETSNGWGRIGSGQWVCMDYMSKYSGSSSGGSSNSGSSAGNDTGRINAGALAASYYPTTNLYNRPIYLMQTDSRWANKMYSSIGSWSQTIGSSACGPTSASMIINQWIDGSYSPVTCCAWSVANGYRTSNNGTAWGLFKALAVKFGLKFLQTAYHAQAYQFMKDNPGALVVCAMDTGNWTSGGHFILMYYHDGNYVYINDPASTASYKLKAAASLLKAECNQYFCFAKPVVKTETVKWAPKDKVEDIIRTNMTVDASYINCRTEPTTSLGNNSIGIFTENTLVVASKKCGDWYYITGVAATGKAISGWGPANYLAKTDIKDDSSATAVLTRKATEHLTELGFIDSPDYWQAHAFDISYVTSLIIAITNAIDYKGAKKPTKYYNDVAVALKALTDAGVINSPDYWLEHYKDLENLDWLICKAACWLC